MKSPTFKISNLSLGYETSHTEVLFIENLEIFEGEITYIIGRSGIGKTTVLELLACINNTCLNPQGATVDFISDTQSKLSLINFSDKNAETIDEIRSRLYSFIFQKNNLFEDLSVLDNIMFIAALRNEDTAAVKKTTIKLFHEFGLDVNLLNKPISHLSEGQRQRVSFIRALVQSYKVLFADEPTGNLDAHTAHKLMKHLKEIIREQNKTALVVSHDIQLALSIADTIICLSVEKDKSVAGINKILRNKSENSWYCEGLSEMNNQEATFQIQKTLMDEWL